MLTTDQHSCRLLSCLTTVRKRVGTPFIESFNRMASLPGTYVEFHSNFHKLTALLPRQALGKLLSKANSCQRRRVAEIGTTHSRSGLRAVQVGRPVPLHTSHCAQTEDDWQSDLGIVRKSTPIVKQQHEAESYTSAHSGSSQTEASKSVRSAHEATKSMATRHVGRKLPKHRRWQSQQQSKILQGSVYDTTKVGCAKASCYPMSVNV